MSSSSAPQGSPSDNTNDRQRVGDIDGFITLLRAACDDRSMNTRLQELLALPDAKRKAIVHTWVSDMMIQGAPRDFIAAIACLADDAVAEKAYEVIFQCSRNRD
jgi:hypothetical protein